MKSSSPQTPIPNPLAGATSPPAQRQTNSDEFIRFATTLAGQYELIREIGRGGMGVVYLARDLKLDREVAIKTLPSHLANDPTIRERFLREARTAGGLSHPNIVPIHRADELGAHVFFVMGFVDGESMAQRLRDGPPVAPHEVLQYMRDVAGALAYAHSRGVVHRDIKAENVLIDRASGRAMVTDFGIARLAESGPLTSTGQILGTVHYLSPEQISGENVDGRSDLYSLGVAGFFALSGRFPFDAPLASAVIIAHVTKPAPPLNSIAPDVPAALAAIIDRCLSKDPAHRYQSGMDLVAALSAALPDVERDEQRGEPASMPVLSDSEAQDVWERAAELQAQTGIVPRPAPIAVQRDKERDLARTSGFRLDDVRAAALEAGIPSQYVEHALAERGLTPLDIALHASSTNAPLAIVDRSAGGKWIGAPTRVEFEVVIDGEVSNRDFDLLGEAIQREVGEMGTLSQVGRSLTWHPTGDRKLQITVLSRDGKTTVRASETFVDVAAACFGPMMAAGVGAIGTGLFAAAVRHGVPVGAALGIWVLGAATTFLMSRALFGSISQRKQKALREIVGSLADHVRASIEAARPKRISP